jgi:putative addiction module killer protein
MLPSQNIEILEYLDESGRSSFANWFDGLGAQLAAKVVVAVSRLAQGNLSNLKSVAGGVLEYRIDFGPGLRIYLGRDGERLIILLGGGTKRQRTDIAEAIARWQDYKKRKPRE